ncbi:MAG: hypothetical protein ACI4HM_00865 [Ruminococcus sp.]
MKDSQSSIFNNKKTGIIMSVVSLILIISLLVVATYSWVEAGNEGEVDSSNNLSFDVTPDLDISGDNVTNGKIEIKDFVLREVSSVDGRNVYVPDDSNYGNDDGKTTTDELRFREANPADVYDGKKGTTPPSNMRYVAFSFYISSPSGEDTDVYLSSTSKITGTGAEYVRMSIDTHDGNAPRVFSSSASVGYPVYTDAVSSIKSSGEYKDLSSQKAEAFATYSYSGEANSLFTIDANKKKFVTITLWLEGASGDFPDKISGTDISANINLKTTQDYVNTIRVMDLTQETWVDDDNCYLFIFDADSYDSLKKPFENPSYQMTYDSATYTWTALIPQEVTNIYIQRYNPDDPENGNWNTWGYGAYKLTIPGAEDLINNGTDAEKEVGITRTYKIFGQYEPETEGIKECSAGIWDENEELNHNSGMTFVYTFDATDTGWVGSDNGSTYIGYEYTTSYNETVELRYKMSYEYNRFWRITLPENMVNSKINFYRCATETATSTYKLISDNSWTNKDYSSTSKFFALTGKTSSYRGTSPIYFYHKDSAETIGAYCHPSGAGGAFQRMYDIDYGKDTNEFTYHAAIVKDSNPQVRFARFAVGTKTSEMAWGKGTSSTSGVVYHYNQANVDVTASSNNSYKIGGYLTGTGCNDDHDKQMFYLSTPWKMTVLPNADETAYGYGK